MVIFHSHFSLPEGNDVMWVKQNVICTIPQSSPKSYVGGMFTFFQMDGL
jgi:hypothetical protein